MPFTAKHLQIFSQNFYRTVTWVFFYQVYNYIYARDFVEIFITVAFTDFMVLLKILSLALLP